MDKILKKDGDIKKLAEKYLRHKNFLYLDLRHLSDDCRQLLQNAQGIIEVNIMEDPTYKVVPG